MCYIAKLGSKWTVPGMDSLSSTFFSIDFKVLKKLPNASIGLLDRDPNLSSLQQRTEITNKLRNRGHALDRIRLGCHWQVSGVLGWFFEVALQRGITWSPGNLG